MTIPRPEHPRPQFMRPTWVSLNGQWDFTIDHGNSYKAQGYAAGGTFDKQITVPFCPESALSGIGYTDFMAAVWYRRTIHVPADMANMRKLLHFGAVDYHCEVWVNGVAVGTHEGGYSSFTFDITDAAVVGDNVVTVYAADDVRGMKQPRGKQSAEYHSHDCDYTRTTGIWQSVWLEYVSDVYIQSAKYITDPKNGKVSIKVKLNKSAPNMTVAATAKFSGKDVGSAYALSMGDMAVLNLPLSEVHLWDVGQGVLYDLTLSLYNTCDSCIKYCMDKLNNPDTPQPETCDCTPGDTVESYFGLRTIELVDGAIHLNGRPVFQRLILDQGFYPDGVYTAPTDAALVCDIELSMELGFNGARLHQKVFEERFLYHADKLGYLVWGEQASWGLDITTAEGLARFLPEWLEIMARDFNHAALVGWCPFNETWDVGGRKQYDDVLRVTYLATKAVDPTRPVIDTSGNYHVITDIFDIHDYDQNVESFAAKLAPMANGGEAYVTFPHRQTYEGQPYFVSEYGGTWWNAKEAAETQSGDGWGYGQRPTSEDEVCARYVGLTSAIMQNPKICAFCYTQLTDVEQEKNGLYYYDRTRKFSDAIYDKIKACNTAIAAIEK